MNRRKVTNDKARSRWARTTEYTKPKGRILYAIYVDGDRYDMSRGKVYIDIVGGCYTDRDKAIRSAWNILDENWEYLVEGRPEDPLVSIPCPSWRSTRTGRRAPMRTTTIPSGTRVGGPI